MASYNIKLKRSAQKEIEAIPLDDRQRIIVRIGNLADEPRPFGCQKLKGDTGYRIRQGDYRIVYLIDDSASAIDIIKAGHRREIYR